MSQRRGVGGMGFLILSAAFLLPAVAMAQAWPVNHVYSGAGGSPYGVYDVTFGGTGMFSAVPGRNPGQLAWSLDGTVMYASQFDSDSVVAVTPSGVTTTVATGINGPTGLLMTRTGKLLVVSFYSNAIFDVTAGGDFTAATALVTGLSGPRNLVQLADGRILVACQSNGSVFDVNYPTGGAVGTAFANGLGSIGDLAQDATGRIFVSRYGASQVMDITAGGDFSAGTAFASGRGFMGLAVDGEGRLLASELSGTGVYDITAGGDFSAAAPFATTASGGETALDVVRYPTRAVDVALEPPGANCAQGGEAVIVCQDWNGDEACGPGDVVEEIHYVCNGVPGTNGTNGTNGKDGGCSSAGSTGWVGLVAFLGLALTRRRVRREA